MNPFTRMWRRIHRLLSEHLPPEKTSQELFKTEMQNLSMYGYGAKGFMLSMIETAIRVSGGAAEAGAIARIIELGKSLMSQPVRLIEGVDAVIDRLSARYTLVVATKGDLVDQERKLAQSGLTDYFHHIEIMSDKREANYSRLLHHLDIGPERFTMIGNSVRSDIERCSIWGDAPSMCPSTPPGSTKRRKAPR